MTRGGEITGVVGRLEWAYYVAAALNGYTVTRSPENTWRLSATVVMADAFKLRQRPLIFAAPHAKGVWRWPVETCHVEQSQLRATLGPPLP